MKDEQYLSERKAAVKAGVSRNTLRKHRTAGLIEPLAIGYAVLYPITALEKYMVRRGRPLAERK